MNELASTDASGENKEDNGLEGPRISLNALVGVITYQTMRIRGHVGKQLVHILIDSRSTSIFWIFKLLEDWDIK